MFSKMYRARSKQDNEEKLISVYPTQKALIRLKLEEIAMVDHRFCLNCTWFEHGEGFGVRILGNLAFSNEFA